MTASAAAPKKRQKRQHWFAVVVPKGEKVQKHRFNTMREMLKFAKAHTKTHDVLGFVGRLAELVPQTDYEIKVVE